MEQTNVELAPMMVRYNLAACMLRIEDPMMPHEHRLQDQQNKNLDALMRHVRSWPEPKIEPGWVVYRLRLYDPAATNWHEWAAEELKCGRSVELNHPMDGSPWTAGPIPANGKFCTSDARMGKMFKCGCGKVIWDLREMQN